MPVLITEKVTDPKKGKISETDLYKIKSDFVHQVKIKPENGRQILLKKYSVAVMANEIKELIEANSDDKENAPNHTIHLLKFNFAVHLNQKTACGDDSDPNSITVVIETAEFINPEIRRLGHVSHNAEGDYVVIPAYKNFLDKIGDEPPCCPSSNP